MRASKPLIMILAGEPSGDFLGARLMEAVRRVHGGDVHFCGVGGTLMQAAGLESLFDQREIAHMGVFEVVRHLGTIVARLRQTQNAVRTRKPDILVTIDSPDFTLRVAPVARGLGIPVIHYVAPTVWAWRPKRAEKLARCVDHLMTLLPFEPPYFTQHGLATTFVGHPLVESGSGHGDGERFRARHGLAHDTPLLSVLPGSRRGEVRRLLPLFTKTLISLHARYPALAVAVPTVPTVADDVHEAVTAWPMPAIVTTSEADKYDALAASQAALACSGTVALELALAGVPHVIAYRAHPLTAWLVRRMVKVRYASLVNLLHDRLVTPEFLQEQCTPQSLTDALSALLDHEDARMSQREALADVAQWLGFGQFIPSERAASVVIRTCDRSTSLTSTPLMSSVGA